MQKTWAALALVVNALVWGLSWWPFRELQSRGLHSLWATALIYSCACLCIMLFWRDAFKSLRERPHLLTLFVAAGITNVSFNWGVTVGDVVRVVLLFYLMPIWVVILARMLLGERITPIALFRVALALAGAGLVLYKPESGLPWPQSLADYLGIAGGMAFGLNNVMLRKYADEPASARALAMFGGGAIMSAALALLLTALGAIASPLGASGLAWAGGFALTVFFLIGNLSLQYGAARLSANATAVIMLSEIIFATISAVLLAHEKLNQQTIAGGVLIMLAASLAAWTSQEKHA
jgi:drug/metabolite transporter (DMT)-like permease